MTKSMKLSMAGVLAVAMLALFALAGCSSPSTDSGSAANNDNGSSSESGNASNESSMSDQSKAGGIGDGTVLKVPNGWVAYSEKNMIVLLDSDATTGYQWTAEINGTSVLKDTDADLPSSTYYDQNTDDVVGAAGMHVFGFMGDTSGDSTITMKLADPAGSGNVDATIMLKVTVDNGMFTAVSVQES